MSKHDDLHLANQLYLLLYLAGDVERNPGHDQSNGSVKNLKKKRRKRKLVRMENYQASDNHHIHFNLHGESVESMNQKHNLKIGK